MSYTLYVDVHFSSTAIDLLARAGASSGGHVEAFHEHNASTSDPERLKVAAQQGWTILTRDQDFRVLHEQWYVLQAWRPLTPPEQHGGFIWVDASPGLLADDEVVEPVIQFLARTPSHPNSLYILSRRPAGVS
ncbi:MAG: DUF5615 family PIN-like protein [Chloroflexota bacterium]